jgi:hypothetical protein
MMMKQFYAAPTVEQVPMEALSVMAGSQGSSLPGSYTPGTDIFLPSTSGRAGYGSGSNYAASGGDLEEMISDILTY